MAKVKRSSKPWGWIAAILALLLWRQFGPGLPSEDAYGEDAIAKLFATQQSGQMVEFEGRVQRTLPDDITGTPHQRFIVELDNGHSLLVSHNLKLAGHIPLEPWYPIRIRGEYEWNAQGGLVHWTHRDPGIGLKHGWIEYQGTRYQ